jgi:hypothetical protein
MAQPGKVAAYLVAKRAPYPHAEIKGIGGALPFQYLGSVGPALVQGNAEALWGGRSVGNDGPHRLPAGAVGTEAAFNSKGRRR